MTEMDAYEAALAARIKESADRKDDSGRFRSILKDNMDRPVLKLAAGEHIMDILPYTAGVDDPFVPEGTITYCLEVYVHYGVGPTEDAFVCPARTFGARKNPNHQNERCPICEHQSALRQEEGYDEEVVKSLNPKRRVLYWVILYDTVQEEQKGPQLLDVAHWHMERHLATLSKIQKGRGGSNVGGVINFVHPQKGKSIAFTKTGKAPNIDFTGHKFEDRIIDEQPYAIQQKDLDIVNALPLDQCVVIPEYKDLYIAFFGEEPGERTSRRTSTAVTDMGDGTSVVPTEDSPSRRRGSASLSRRPLPTQEEAPPQEEPKEAPPQEEPKEAPPQEATGNECPAGHVFGVDAEKFDACDDCSEELYQKCLSLKMKAETSQKSNRRLS